MQGVGNDVQEWVVSSALSAAECGSSCALAAVKGHGGFSGDEGIASPVGGGVEMDE